jgi:hypothetical protein
MEVAVIPKLMAFLRHAPHELWPTLGVTSQNEEGRVHAFVGECVENQRSGIGIRTIVECQCYDFPIPGNSAQSGTKEWTVAVKCAVYRPAYD